MWDKLEFHIQLTPGRCRPICNWILPASILAKSRSSFVCHGKILPQINRNLHNLLGGGKVYANYLTQIALGNGRMHLLGCTSHSNRN